MVVSVANPIGTRTETSMLGVNLVADRLVAETVTNRGVLTVGANLVADIVVRPAVTNLGSRIVGANVVSVSVLTGTV